MLPQPGADITKHGIHILMCMSNHQESQFEVLVHNEAALELQQTKLTNMITDTERHLSTATEGTDKITQYY